MLLQILLWIILITTFTLFGSWYVRKYNSPDALIGLYVSFVLISNILAFKIAEFDLGFISFYSDSATLVFSVTFLLTDIVNEKFGRKETQKMILIAFLTQLAVVLFVWLSLMMPAAPFWDGNEAFSQVIGLAPRIMLASWVAFLIGENLDAYLFAWFKKWTKGKYLWMRNIFSSLPSMVVDTSIFVVIAFGGLEPLWPLIVGTLAIKWLVGFVNIPFMYLNRWVMGKN